MKKDRNGVYEAEFSLDHFLNYFFNRKNFGPAAKEKILCLKNSMPQAIRYFGRFPILEDSLA
ncbi:hypothetical protein [Bartonella apihabitans]|uniref:hypothetical protein n=1 Tax=Bartonella apihabitans TaxID=2750929 RepID=UPI003BB5BA80